MQAARREQFPPNSIPPCLLRIYHSAFFFAAFEGRERLKTDAQPIHIFFEEYVTGDLSARLRVPGWRQSFGAG
jgi:hypothetical protein